MPELIRKAGWREKALLVAGFPSKDTIHPDQAMDELELLAEAAGAQVQSRLVQTVNRPNRATYIGQGKAEEAAALVRRLGLDVIISGNNLSPAQVRNLESLTQTKVIDRTELIMDIFARRAKTRQAKLQVELAQLEYALPRLRRMWTHLSRIEGGIGLRGPGEKQLEMDRRLVQKKVTELKRSLDRIRKRKKREVASRGSKNTACLVGYTNAGKSTLLNRMTGSNVPESKKLFSTLDTRTRLLSMDQGMSVLLSDTVGFIEDLPHTLVESFHATLEEASQADLLLHVVDLAHPDPYPRIRSVESVLKEIGLDSKPTILVFNKVDALEDRIDLQILQSRHPDSVAVSARTAEGVDALQEMVRAFFLREMVDFNIRTHPGNGRLLAFLRKIGKVSSVTYEGESVHVQGRILERHLGQAVKMHGQESGGEGEDA